MKYEIKYFGDLEAQKLTKSQIIKRITGDQFGHMTYEQACEKLTSLPTNEWLNHIVLNALIRITTTIELQVNGGSS